MSHSFTNARTVLGSTGLRFALGLGILLSTACASQKEEPLTASSAGQASYAESYPDQLAATRQRSTDGETDARTTMQAMATYPDELKNTDYNGVLEVVNRADEAGRSSTYAQSYAEAEEVARFHTEEKEKLGQQVGGSVRYVLKEKGANQDQIDAGGSAAVRGMDKAVTKQLEERVRAHNEAHRYIEDNEETLGKANIEKLQKQADDIARASYVTNVQAVEQQRALKAQVDEASDVKSTLQKTIDSERAIAADANTTPGRKAAAEKRAAAAEASLGKLDAEVEQANASLKDLEKRNEQLKKDYDKALEDLKKKLEDLAKAQPEQPKAS